MRRATAAHFVRVCVVGLPVRANIAEVFCTYQVLSYSLNLFINLLADY